MGRVGNTPLHHAASLVEADAGVLISLFVEHGSCPKMSNHRGQTPIHLFCHNQAARRFVFYHEALHLIAFSAVPSRHLSCRTACPTRCTSQHEVEETTEVGDPLDCGRRGCATFGYDRGCATPPLTVDRNIDATTACTSQSSLHAL